MPVTIRSTDIRTFRKSPRHYQLKDTQPQTFSMNLGTAFHMKLSEPKKFQDTYIPKPEFEKKSKTQPLTIKEQELAFLEANRGKEILSTKDLDVLDLMHESAMSNPFIEGIFKKQMVIEEKLIHPFTFDDKDVLIQGTPDIILPDENIIIDIKTSADASFDKFQQTIAKFEYFIQSAVYIMLAEKQYNKSFTDFIWIVVENSWPYNVATYYMEKDLIDLGREIVNKTVPKMLTAIEKGIFHGYTTRLTPIGLPHYSKYKYFNEGVYDGI